MKDKGWGWKGRKRKTGELGGGGTLTSTTEERTTQERNTETCRVPAGESAQCQPAQRCDRAIKGRGRTVREDLGTALARPKSWKESRFPSVKLENFLIHQALGRIQRKVLPLYWEISGLGLNAVLGTPSKH